MRVIYDPIFRRRVFYVNVSTGSEYKRIVEPSFNFKSIFDDSADAGFESIIEPSPRLFIWGPKDRIELIAHECVHVAFFVSSMIGIPIEYNNDEFIAYYTMFLMNNIYGDMLKERIYER